MGSEMCIRDRSHRARQISIDDVARRERATVSARDGVETAHGTRHAHGTEGAIGEGASHENGDGGIDADATAHRDASASAADRRKSREGSRGWAAQR